MALSESRAVQFDLRLSVFICVHLWFRSNDCRSVHSGDENVRRRHAGIVLPAAANQNGDVAQRTATR
jgi:hypothetical protein